MSIRERDISRQRWLDTIYPIPSDDWVLYEGTSRRYFNRDLEDLTFEQLELEERNLLYRLRFDRNPDQWLFDRLDAIRQARSAVARTRKAVLRG